MVPVTADSATTAYIRLLRAIKAAPGKRLRSVAFEIVAQNGMLVEDPAVVAAVDAGLAARRDKSVSTVRNTIFPRSLWNAARPRGDLYSRYERMIPRLRRSSRRGTYFERLIAYRPVRGAAPINQLEHVISTFRSGRRRPSIFQVSIFNPATDHSRGPRLGFPCLQHMAFTFDVGAGEMGVVAFYAHQFLRAKAYGNYLGIADVGRFVATETGVRFAGLMCTLGTASWDGTVADLDALLAQFPQIV